MLRQMEYNADAFQVQVVGSETFETTHRKFATLGAATQQTYKLIHTRWKKTRQLPDNLSELIRQTHETLPAGVLQKIDDTLGFGRTGIFDTHPSAADRIRRARMAGAPGIFHDDRPASSLFASFEHPARFVTLLHYTESLGIPITDRMLLRVESTQPKSAQGYLAGAASKSAADEFFLGVLPLLAPLRIAPPVPSADYEKDVTELNQLSSGLQGIAGQLAPIAEQYKDISLKLVNARAALRLLHAGVAIQSDAFGLAEPTVQSVQAAEAEAVASRDALRHSLREISTALNRRMQLALAIRLSDKGESGANYIPPERVHELVTALNQFADLYPKHQETAGALVVFGRISAVAKAEGESPTLSRALEAQKQIISSLTEQPAETTGAAPQPAVRLARRQSHLTASDLESLQDNCTEWFSDYQKMVDQLAEIARGAETISL